MHLATAVQTKTIGLFSVSDPHTYGPYGNNSTYICVNEHTIHETVEAIAKIITGKSGE